MSIFTLIAAAEKQDTETLIVSYVALGQPCPQGKRAEYLSKAAIADVLIRREGEALLDELDAA